MPSGACHRRVRKTLQANARLQGFFLGRVVRFSHDQHTYHHHEPGTGCVDGSR